MKNLKYVAVIGLLIVAVVFLLMDNCGSDDKYNRLKGEYETYSAISKVIVLESIKAINEQDREIVALDKKITFLHDIIEVKDKDLADKEDELGVIKRNFESLEACQSQYDKLAAAFSLCKSIGLDKDQLIFNLNEKYKAQVVISMRYKDMYESEYTLRLKGEEVTKACDKALKRIQFFSKVKTGVVVGCALLVLYNMVK